MFFLHKKITSRNCRISSTFIVKLYLESFRELSTVQANLLERFGARHQVKSCQIDERKYRY